MSVTYYGMIGQPNKTKSLQKISYQEISHDYLEKEVEQDVNTENCNKISQNTISIELYLVRSIAILPSSILHTVFMPRKEHLRKDNSIIIVNYLKLEFIPS